MPIISKHMEMQEKIISTFEALEHTLSPLKVQLAESALLKEKAFDRYIASNFQKEYLLERVNSRHDTFELHYHTLLLVYDTILAFQDFDGMFIDPKQLLFSLEILMLKHADDEKYEMAAIIKEWHEKFSEAVYFVDDMAY